MDECFDRSKVSCETENPAWNMDVDIVRRIHPHVRYEINPGTPPILLLEVDDFMRDALEECVED
jgi:hypothetical protein